MTIEKLSIKKDFLMTQWATFPESVFNKINELIDAFNSLKMTNAVTNVINSQIEVGEIIKNMIPEFYKPEEKQPEPKETTLLGCPWCAKQPSLEEDDETYAIKCINFECAVQPMSIWDETKEFAIINWNTRANHG